MFTTIEYHNSLYLDDSIHSGGRLEQGRHGGNTLPLVYMVFVDIDVNLCFIYRSCCLDAEHSSSSCGCVALFYPLRAFE